MTLSPRCSTAGVLVAASTALTGCALPGGGSSSPSASSTAAAQSSAFLSPSPYPSAGRSLPPWGSSTSASRGTGSTDPSSSSTSPTASPRHPSSPASRIAGPTPITASTANAAALFGVKAIESSDTTVDVDPHDTVQRAAVWLTPAFAAQVKAYPPVAAPGASWNTWSSHRAYVVVTTRLGGDEHLLDTAATAYRQVLAVLHPIGRDGWHGAAVTAVVSVSLARISGQWRLASSQSS